MTGSDAQVTKNPVHMHSMNIVCVCDIIIKVGTCLSTAYVNHEDGVQIIAYHVCMQKPCAVDAISVTFEIVTFLFMSPVCLTLTVHHPAIYTDKRKEIFHWNLHKM